MMLVFIDESGDSGMKFRAGSSAYFVICAVLFMCDDDAHACESAINEVRQANHLHEGFEFHFNKCSSDIRKKFLDRVRRQNFRYTAFVLNKKKLTGEGFQYKESFYKYAVKIACQNLAEHLDRATVVIDQCGDRKFIQELSKYLRREINKAKPDAIKKIKSEHSHNNNLVQLADMICGSVARSFRTDRQHRFEYRNLVRARELRVQLWPK